MDLLLISQKQKDFAKVLFIFYENITFVKFRQIFLNQINNKNYESISH